MNTVTQLNARLQSFLPLKQETPGNTPITMRAETYTSGLTRKYTAIVAPGTKIVKDAIFLTIENAEKNYYEVKVNTDMLSTAEGKWGYGLSGANQILADNYIVTQPGVNYHLELRIDKSTVQVSASLENWSTVEAAGTGAIQFNNNEIGFLTTNTGLFNDNSTFGLFRKASTSDAYTYDTTSKYSSSTAKWTNDPIIYWPNMTDNYYFRALANVDGSVDTNPITITARNTLTDITSGYILWGTTAAHSSYDRGAAIPPRTGGVPMEFRVVNKCKVSFNLATAASGDARVALTGATISINNIYNTGSINLEDGTVTGSATTTLNGTNSIAEQEVLAQIINTEAVVTVTLAGNAGVYTIPLKNCKKADTETEITVWEGGHTYNYTIHVEKEDVKFSAVVKPWATVSGSGTASLNW